MSLLINNTQIKNNIIPIIKHYVLVQFILINFKITYIKIYNSRVANIFRKKMIPMIFKVPRINIYLLKKIHLV